MCHVLSIAYLYGKTMYVKISRILLDFLKGHKISKSFVNPPQRNDVSQGKFLALPTFLISIIN